MKTTTAALFFLAALSVSATPTPPAAAAPQIMSVADNQAYTLVVHLYTKEGEENINKVKAKLQEASQVYSKDRETLSWYVPTYLLIGFLILGKKGKQLLIFLSLLLFSRFVMQDHLDARKFTIVERYVNESSQKYVSAFSLFIHPPIHPSIHPLPSTPKLPINQSIPSIPRYHLENPYWQTFDPYVKPLLAEEMDLRRYNELDLSQEVRVVQNETLWNEVEEYQNQKDC